jgi:alpha-tubulin suppressor-like RCC1 family protein
MNRRQALSILAASPLALTRTLAQSALPPAARRRVVIGESQGVLVEADGTLKTWMMQPRSDGRAPDWLGLGDNRPLEEYILVPIAGVSNVVKAVAGSGCSFALLSDGRILGWGWNSGYGLLGITSRAALEATASWAPNSNKPVSPVVPIDAIDVSSRYTHVLAAARDGSVYAWGRGTRGELGVGPLPLINFKDRTPAAMTYVPFPVRVPDLGDVTAVAAGLEWSLALLKDGTVRAWGANHAGQLGDGTTMNRDRPVPVQGVRDAVAIVASSECSMALLANGTVMMWGNLAGKPGPVPALVPGAVGIRSIVAGAGHAAGLTNAGTVLTWGDNTHYQLGRGKAANVREFPAGLVGGLTDVQAIGGSYGTETTAVLSSGKIMTWGSVRPWTRPDGGGGGYSPFPILLWVDGLEQPGT